MKNKTTTLLTAFLLGIFLFSACEKDKIEETATLTVQATSETEIPDYTKFEVELKELRTLKSKKVRLTDKGTCEIRIDKGSYTITIEWKSGNVSVFGTKENLSVTKDETVSIPLTATISKPSGIIFKEIFFNGETNNGKMMHPDQYFVLYNNSDETLYADGIVFTTSAHANWNEADIFTEQLPEEIVVPQLFSIPGNGMEYPLAPGEQIVVARTAINHNAEYENAVDLSGADIEVYEPDMPEKFGTDVDNPDVPNMIVHFSEWGLFNMHPRGPLVPFIFKPDTDMKTFMETHKFEYTNNKGEKKFLYKVPVNMVLDGIETGNEGFVKVKSLPLSVDKGFITVTGCHRQELIRRKKAENGKLMDTGNSTVDCERVKGQNAFPKKTSKSVSVRLVELESEKETYHTTFPNGVQEFANSGWDIK